MKKKILVTDINWDVDGDDIDELGFPNEIMIDNPFGGQWIVGAVGLATIFNATMLFITSLLMVGALALCFFGGLDLVRMGGLPNMLGGTICFMLFFGLAFGIARLCFCF